jgi:hypothetical protein
MTQIIVTIITGLVAIITCTINSIYQASATRKMTEYKIEELSKRVDKHNSVIERTYKLEELTALQEEKIKVANHRIDDLEHRH